MCLFILLKKYLDSTYYIPGTVLSALQIIHLILITHPGISPTDDNMEAHNVIIGSKPHSL